MRSITRFDGSQQINEKREKKNCTIFVFVLVYPNAFQPQTQPMMYGSVPFPYALHNMAMNRNQPTLPYMPAPAMQPYPFPYQMPMDQSMNPYNPLNMLIQSAIVRLVMSLAIANKNVPLPPNAGTTTFVFLRLHANKNYSFFLSPERREERFITRHMRVNGFSHL